MRVVIIVMMEIVGEGQAAKVDGRAIREKGKVIASRVVAIRASQSLGTRISRVITDRGVWTWVFSGGIGT